MEVKSSERAEAEAVGNDRKWDEPAILMERSLNAEAQGEGELMDDPFLGPLGISP